MLTGPITYANSDAIVRRGNSEEEGREDDDVINQVCRSLTLFYRTNLVRFGAES